MALINYKWLRVSDDIPNDGIKRYLAFNEDGVLELAPLNDDDTHKFKNYTSTIHEQGTSSSNQTIFSIKNWIVENITESEYYLDVKLLLINKGIDNLYCTFVYDDTDSYSFFIPKSSSTTIPITKYNWELQLVGSYDLYVYINYAQ